jgi:hypothetical protein
MLGPRWPRLASPSPEIKPHLFGVAVLPNQHLQLTRARCLRQPPRFIFGLEDCAAAAAQRPRS